MQEPVNSGTDGYCLVVSSRSALPRRKRVCTTLRLRVAANPIYQPKETLGIVAGQELPRRGRCTHYGKSYRWFRFVLSDSILSQDMLCSQPAGSVAARKFSHATSMPLDPMHIRRMHIDYPDVMTQRQTIPTNTQTA